MPPEIKMPIRRPPSRIIVDDFGDLTVVNFIDRNILESIQIAELGRDLEELVAEFSRKRVVLNMANVVYLSEAFLGKFITLNKKLLQNGGHLVLCNLNAQILEVLQVTRLDRLLMIANDEATARQLINPNSAAADGQKEDAKALHLSGAHVTDDSLNQLFECLRSLNLANSMVTDDGLKKLASLKFLQYLYLQDTGLTDSATKELACFQTLEILDLSGTKVTDVGLKELACLQKLRKLYLGGTRITEAGIEKLHKALPNCAIVRWNSF